MSISALDMYDYDDDVAKERAKVAIRALADFDKITGGFVRNAVTEGEFESRLRYVDTELDHVAQDYYDGDRERMVSMIRAEWGERTAAEGEFPFNFDKDKAKEKEGPAPKKDKPDGDKSDKEDDEKEPLGEQTIPVEQTLSEGSELVVTVDVLPPTEAGIDWDRFGELDVSAARDVAAAHALANRSDTEDPVLAYMAAVIGAKEGYLAHRVAAEILHQASLVRTAHPKLAESDAYNMGREAGESAGSWVIDGNTDTDTVRRILQGIEDGDPEIMDMAPQPLSGEWAGQSIPEIFGSANPSDDDMGDYEQGYSEGFWYEVERSARATLGDEPSPTTQASAGGTWEQGRIDGFQAAKEGKPRTAGRIDGTEYAHGFTAGFNQGKLSAAHVPDELV